MHFLGKHIRIFLSSHFLRKKSMNGILPYFPNPRMSFFFALTFYRIVYKTSSCIDIVLCEVPPNQKLINQSINALNSMFVNVCYAKISRCVVTTFFHVIKIISRVWAGCVSLSFFLSIDLLENTIIISVCFGIIYIFILVSFHSFFHFHCSPLLSLSYLPGLFLG